LDGLIMLGPKCARLSSLCGEQDTTLGTLGTLNFAHRWQIGTWAGERRILQHLGAQARQLYIERCLNLVKCRTRMLTPPFFHRVQDFLAQRLPACLEFV
jgi:hypothetical protein